MLVGKLLRRSLYGISGQIGNDVDRLVRTFSNGELYCRHWFHLGTNLPQSVAEPCPGHALDWKPWELTPHGQASCPLVTVFRVAECFGRQYKEALFTALRGRSDGASQEDLLGRCP